jgi:hypothetical protein
VNLLYYDAEDRTRDALLIGGSDSAGTLTAGKAFLQRIADMGGYMPPVLEKQFDVFKADEHVLKERIERVPPR